MNRSKRGGQTIHIDEYGEEYVLDENGNRQTPMQSRVASKKSGFTTYDDSKGHCSFCGRLSCRGECFK